MKLKCVATALLFACSSLGFAAIPAGVYVCKAKVTAYDHDQPKGTKSTDNPILIIDNAGNCTFQTGAVLLPGGGIVGDNHAFYVFQYGEVAGTLSIHFGSNGTAKGSYRFGATGQTNGISSEATFSATRSLQP